MVHNQHLIFLQSKLLSDLLIENLINHLHFDKVITLSDLTKIKTTLFE